MLKKIKSLIKKCNNLQFDHAQIDKYKLKAMSETLDMFDSKGEVVDIGFVKGYGQLYKNKGFKVIPYNLPKDMHYFNLKSQRIVARHVLEHSLFPALVLQNMYDSLIDKGQVVIIIPENNDYWTRYQYHFSVLHKNGWKQLFKFVGFKIKKEVKGKWNPNEGFVEYRFLLEK